MCGPCKIFVHLAMLQILLCHFYCKLLYNILSHYKSLWDVISIYLFDLNSAQKVQKLFLLDNIKTESLKHRRLESSFIRTCWGVELAGIVSTENVSFWHIWFVTHPYLQCHIFTQKCPIVMNEMSLERYTHGLLNDMKFNWQNSTHFPRNFNKKSFLTFCAEFI